MFRSIWFWVSVIIVGAALWLGRDQIASYFDKLPMEAQQRTTNTRQLASATPRPTSSRTASSTVTPSGAAKPPTLATGVVRPTSRPLVTPAPRYTTYVVKKGDTLYSISKRYRTSVEALQRLNAIADPSTLAVGQELKVPAPPTPRAVKKPVVKPGTTTYKVQKGDTLSSIARKFNTTTPELQKLNNFSNPNKLVVGSVILVPAAKTLRPTVLPSTPVAKPSSPMSGDTEVHSLPVTPTSSLGGASAATQPVEPTATPTPSPIPTMPSVCDGAQEAVFVWGVSFCIPPGWDLQEYAQPHRTALLSKREAGGDLSIYAISRLDGSPHAPLSWSMRQAKKSASSEIASIIPGGLAEPEEWGLATGVSIADVEGQVADARSTYLKSGHPAHVRVVVFNHGDQRWRIVIVAPETLWQNYNISVFPYIARTLEVF